jgi:hypothetical protein
VNAWGRATFGDPCRECGYAWDVEPDDAARIVADAPAAFRQALAGEDGTRTHPDLGWPAPCGPSPAPPRTGATPSPRPVATAP